MVVFSEDHNSETCRRGRIEVICGSMFSGKTEELIRRLRRATFAKQRVEIFKPAIDNVTLTKKLYRTTATLSSRLPSTRRPASCCSVRK